MFRPLKLEDKALFDGFRKYGVSHSQYNFTNLFMWKHEYKPVIDVIDGFLCIILNYYGHKMSLFPIGAGDVSVVIGKIIREFGNISFTALNDEMINILSTLGKIKTYNVRKNYDYVYFSEKLSALHGKKLHSKRNHLRKFVSSYNFEYRSITSDNIADCILIEQKWIAGKNFSTRAANSEFLSTVSVLDNFDYLGCRGGIIYVNEIPSAYSVGENMSDNMAVIHIEKAVGDYQGIYAAINQISAMNTFSDVMYINREEDMGIDLLKKAKLSYYPDKMLEYKRARFVL